MAYIFLESFQSIEEVMPSKSIHSTTAADRMAEKQARLSLRSTQAQKSLIERAASLTGESVTSFILSTALRDARRVVQENEITELSVRDWERFTQMLNSPAEPNEKLKEAAKRYRDRVKASHGF